MITFTYVVFCRHHIINARLEILFRGEIKTPSNFRQLKIGIYLFLTFGGYFYPPVEYKMVLIHLCL